MNGPLRKHPHPRVGIRWDDRVMDVNIAGGVNDVDPLHGERLALGDV